MSSPVRRELEEYVAGRGGATRVVTAVMDAYYREEGSGKREALRPVIDVIERAAPGVVELAAAGDTPGFRVRLAERPFPERYANELRAAADMALQVWAAEVEKATPPPSPQFHASPPPPPAGGMLQRVLGAIRRWFGG
jgi:hypothetical protein